MATLAQRPIAGFDETGEKSVINGNYRFTYGFVDNKITVKVDKIVRPDLTREHNDEEITFEEVASREFTSSEFALRTDHMAWYVDFDVVNNTILDPLDVIAYGAANAYKEPNYNVFGLHRDLMARYDSYTLLPMFYVKTFDYGTVNFENSLIVFYTVKHTEPSPGDTILNNEVITLEDENATRFWIRDNLLSAVTFSIKDSEGNSVGNVSPKLESTPTKRRYGVTDEPAMTPKLNAYVATLPAGKYNVTCSFAKELYPTAVNSYDIEMINGISAKNNITIGAGQSDVNIDLTGLSTGDVSRMKFNLGAFTAYAQLLITIS